MLTTPFTKDKPLYPPPPPPTTHQHKQAISSEAKQALVFYSVELGFIVGSESSDQAERIADTCLELDGS